MPNLHEQFGQIDIYLFDQILRGRIAPGMRILDAGCGSGRNLIYLLRENYEIHAADSDPQAIAAARQLAPHLPAANFRHETIEAMTFPDAHFDVVLLSAVLHFARDDGHFFAMLKNAWRTLKPNGLLFARLASSIGIENLVQPIEGRRARLPDGSTRYLVDEPLLIDLTRQLNARLADPLKTTIVQNQRAMTTWVITKN